MPETFSHFWQMVWEQGASVVLMLTNFVEKGHHKCHEYFPMSDKKFDVDQFELSLLTEEKKIQFHRKETKTFFKTVKGISGSFSFSLHILA